FRLLLERGVYIPPSQFEGMFVSTAHTDADIDRTLEVHREVLKQL
nr:aspartate aminotransferase family protein [Bacillota bacterium]